ncbi:hypothetical protein BEWA_018470 [Theileria equi strain WA]|uniref:EGF-like domain-containing protein n=1 Tax=Theileria equi strain WA TaxID=1537102 RepID=L0ATN0_THEEQ|nr:hypothetical protein BEWA_018470 [Theileria equi strain WA]AFZ79002.1 hypothetical protein BEWA_018470 [Theileria equi strain WA]|eukprot:XP_004828668.1 hypothetical protein BEWA_018470 [Theileria equi strain WA]
MFIFGILIKKTTADFVNRNSVKYYKQGRTVTIRASQLEVNIDCKDQIVHILSAFEHCRGTINSFTSKAARECENKNSCLFKFECPDAHLGRVISYNCRSPEPFDVTTETKNATYVPQDGSAVLRCGNNRFLDIVQAHFLSGHHKKKALLSTNVTDLVSRGCGFAQACTFIPKNLPKFNPELRDRFIYIQFTCVTEAFVCRQITCRENSTCKHDGLGPTKCICNHGYIDVNSICVKRNEVSALKSSDRPPWRSWGRGIPGQLGTLGPSPMAEKPEEGITIVDRSRNKKVLDKDNNDGKGNNLTDENIESDKSIIEKKDTTLHNNVMEGIGSEINDNKGPDNNETEAELQKEENKGFEDEGVYVGELDTENPLGTSDPSGLDEVLKVLEESRQDINDDQEMNQYDVIDIPAEGVDNVLHGDNAGIMEHMIYTNWLCQHRKPTG